MLRLCVQRSVVEKLSNSRQALDLNYTHAKSVRIN